MGGTIIIHPIFFLILAVFTGAAAASPAQTQADSPQDIGRPYPGHEQSVGAFRGLTELGVMMDLSFRYSHLGDSSMSGAYSGLPQLGTTLSLATGDRSRFFLSVHYGQKSGDPYHDIDGFSDEDGMTVKALPLMIGMKYNTSQRQDFRLYLGGAFIYSFLWEDLTTRNANNNPVLVEASGNGTGYYFFVGPEFPLGKGSQALGAEFGFGGSKGEVRKSSHSHGVNMTGVQARVYFTFGL